MHARSAVVDLYGDHLRSRGWWAPVSAVVGLAENVQVRPPATRTAVSRLAAQGWLEARPADGIRGYAATPLAQDRWRRAHHRIYAPGPAAWDGRWHVVHVTAGGDRRARDQVASTLAYLGYGRLGAGSWLSPRPSPELAGSLARLEVSWVAVHGHLDDDTDPRALVARVWDLAELASAYARFSSTLPTPAEAGLLGPEAAYPARTHLVHDWRRFLFRDPDLPPEVLQTDWPGHRARQDFLALAAALAPAAEAHVASALAAAGWPPDAHPGQAR